MKKITFQITMPVKEVSKNKEFIVKVDNHATFVNALAKVDKFAMAHPEKAHFSDDHNYIRSYLQLFWDPKENEIYSDIRVFAASPKGFMPIERNINFNLHNDSEISLTSSS
ncbi:MAG: hypothetical protein R6U96_01160 [Promethearchaeia archaeon]